MVKWTRTHQELVDFSRPYFESADINWVKKNIQNLQTVFRKEVNKVEESKRSGAGMDDLYHSPFWYYDLLLFTLEQEPVRQSSSIMAEKEPRAQEEEELAFSLEESAVNSDVLLLPAPFPLKYAMYSSLTCLAKALPCCGTAGSTTEGNGATSFGRNGSSTAAVPNVLCCVAFFCSKLCRAQ